LPTGIRIGTDLFALGKTQFQKSFSGWEFNADVDFNKYFVAVDYGQWGRTYHPTNGYYANDGKYWRAGVDVNFLNKDPDHNMFFIGFRYGRSRFSENYNIDVVDPVWGAFTESYTNTNVDARWLELTSGLRLKIWKFIWMGYTGRFKFGLKTSSTPTMLPHDVPGYGRTNKDTYWGFNYQIFFRIPFRESPPVPVK
jgi:hypothetical protein